MNKWFAIGIAGAVFAAPVSGALVWRPGEGWTDESGSTVSASSSKEQLEMAKKLEAAEDYKSAYAAYKGLIRRWPLSFSAPEAQFQLGQIDEKRGDFWRAYQNYQKMLEKYPNSSFFEEALERVFQIGNLYLAGEPQRIWKIPLGPSMEKTVEIYQNVIRAAPYGKHAAQAQFNIGLAQEKAKKYNEAVAAYNALIDRYPGSDLVDDAQYQIGYVWKRASSEPEYDQSAAQKSIESFEDFLVRFPNSEKAASARDHIDALQGKRNEGSYKIAQFYKAQGKLKAAEIYFAEVIRESPNTPLAEKAERELDAIRGATATANAKKKEAAEGEQQPAVPAADENLPAPADPGLAQQPG